jgi:NAD(P)-dependent dehydrogenase (short-subunit alcohol dehydrogenase family)
VALVTGASRGLGAAMAQALAYAGADLILWARNARRLARQAQTLKASGRRILAQRVDVTDRAAVHRAIKTAVRTVGHLEILVNNAGIWEGDQALTLSPRVWNRVIETDLTAVLSVSQAAVPWMIKRRYGKIINIASTAAIIAHPEGAAYGTVKAGVVHLSRTLAVEWGPYGVRVTAIAPGVFRTDMTADLYADRTWSRQHQAQVPLRRFGEPQDLAGLAIFLASSASDHITGQTIIIDGGACLSIG